MKDLRNHYNCPDEAEIRRLSDSAWDTGDAVVYNDIVGPPTRATFQLHTRRLRGRSLSDLGEAP